jgi:hypothetical protein
VPRAIRARGGASFFHESIMTSPVPEGPRPERERPEPQPPAPSPEPIPGYDPGPPVRIVDPTPDGPSPELPAEPVRDTPEQPGEPGMH